MSIANTHHWLRISKLFPIDFEVGPGNAISGRKYATFYQVTPTLLMSSHKDYFVIFGFSCRSRIRFFFNILDHDEISELYATCGDLELPDTTEDLIEM